MQTPLPFIPKLPTVDVGPRSPAPGHDPIADSRESFRAHLDQYSDDDYANERSYDRKADTAADSRPTEPRETYRDAAATADDHADRQSPVASDRATEKAPPEHAEASNAAEHATTDQHPDEIDPDDHNPQSENDQVDTPSSNSSAHADKQESDAEGNGQSGNATETAVAALTRNLNLEQNPNATGQASKTGLETALSAVQTAGEKIATGAAGSETGAQNRAQPNQAADTATKPEIPSVAASKAADAAQAAINQAANANRAAQKPADVPAPKEGGPSTTLPETAKAGTLGANALQQAAASSRAPEAIELARLASGRTVEGQAQTSGQPTDTIDLHEAIRNFLGRPSTGEQNAGLKQGAKQQGQSTAAQTKGSATAVSAAKPGVSGQQPVLANDTAILAQLEQQGASSSSGRGLTSATEALGAQFTPSNSTLSSMNLSNSGPTATIAGPSINSALPTTPVATVQMNTSAQAGAPHAAVQEVAVHIARQAAQGVNRFSIRMDPPEMGRIDVRLEMTSDARMHAILSADRPETLELLQRDARVLERALSDAGLKTNPDSLNFSLREQNAQDHQQRNQKSLESKEDHPDQASLEAEDNAGAQNAYWQSWSDLGRVNITV